MSGNHPFGITANLKVKRVIPTIRLGNRQSLRQWIKQVTYNDLRGFSHADDL